MRQKIVAANWKMHGSISKIKLFMKEFLPLAKFFVEELNRQCIIIPPTIYIPLAQELIADTGIKIGAQNVYPGVQGAVTGEVSADMLKDYNCQYVLVGHSERRQIFKEDAKFIAQKFFHIKEYGMIPILCIGETWEERSAGLTEEVLTKQLLPIMSEDNCFKNAVVAYEPVWAIGAGKAAQPDEVQAVHSFLRAFIANFNYNEASLLPIIYGGSLNEKNAVSLLQMPDVDGGLVGSASLEPQKLVEIIKCIN